MRLTLARRGFVESPYYEGSAPPIGTLLSASWRLGPAAAGINGPPAKSHLRIMCVPITFFFASTLIL